MSKRKLIDDVTINKMKAMREQGMSNQEIADALDVSYVTIHRHIGKQPSDMRKKYERRSAQCEQGSTHAAQIPAIQRVKPLFSIPLMPIDVSGVTITQNVGAVDAECTIDYAHSVLRLGIVDRDAEDQGQLKLSIPRNSITSVATFLRYAAQVFAAKDDNNLQTADDAERANADCGGVDDAQDARDGSDVVFYSEDTESDMVPDTAKSNVQCNDGLYSGLIYFKCPNCGNEFFTGATEKASQRCAHCNSRTYLSNEKMRIFKFRCKTCGKVTRGWTNVKNDFIRVKCRCGNDCEIRYDGKFDMYTDM